MSALSLFVALILVAYFANCEGYILAGNEETPLALLIDTLWLVDLRDVQRRLDAANRVAAADAATRLGRASMDGSEARRVAARGSPTAGRPGLRRRASTLTRS